MPKAHCSRQQTVKRTFGMRCVGVTLIPPRQLALRIRLCSKVGGAIDRYVPSAHSYPIRIAAFSAFSACHVSTAVLAHFSKKHFLDCKKIVSDCLDCRYKNRCIYMRRKPLLLVGRLSLCGVERRLIRRPPLSFVPWWPPARRRSTRWRGTHICLAARGGRCGR